MLLACINETLKLCEMCALFWSSRWVLLTYFWFLVSVNILRMVHFLVHTFWSVSSFVSIFVSLSIYAVSKDESKCVFKLLCDGSHIEPTHVMILLTQHLDSFLNTWSSVSCLFLPFFFLFLTSKSRIGQIFNTFKRFISPSLFFIRIFCWQLRMLDTRIKKNIWRSVCSIYKCTLLKYPFSSIFQHDVSDFSLLTFFLFQC